jgi:hypothetical protein
MLCADAGVSDEYKSDALSTVSMIDPRITRTAEANVDV